MNRPNLYADKRRTEAFDAQTGILLVCMLLGAFLLLNAQRMTTYTTDDYYYGSFLQNGFTEFVRLNTEHYIGRNGRVLVHLLAEVFLACNPVVFAIADTAFLGLILWALLSLWSKERGEKCGFFTVFAGLLYTTLWLSTGYGILKHGILCVSDACNYIFPMVLVSLAFRTLRPKNMCGARQSLLSSLLFFVSGATTEQYGILTLTALCLLALRALLATKKIPNFFLLPLLCSLLGTATVLLSPATRGRAATEFSLSAIASSVKQFSCNLAAPNRALHLLLLFSLAAAISAVLYKNLPRALLCGFPVAALLCTGFFVPQSVFYNIIFFSTFAIFLCACGLLLLFKSDHATLGALLLAGFASLLAVSVTSSSNTRVATPFLLILTAAIVHFILAVVRKAAAGKKARKFAATVAALAGFLCAVLLFLPTYRGVRNNYEVLKENETAVEKARQTGELRYTDYDAAYCLCDMFESTLFQEAYFRKYALNPETVCVVSHIQPAAPVLVNGVDAGAAAEKDGVLYFPLRAVTEALGGSLFWASNEYVEIRLSDRVVLYNAPAAYLTENRNTHKYTDKSGLLRYEHSLYISEEWLETLFSAEVSLDGERFLVKSID